MEVVKAAVQARALRTHQRLDVLVQRKILVFEASGRQVKVKSPMDSSTTLEWGNRGKSKASGPVETALGGPHHHNPH